MKTASLASHPHKQHSKESAFLEFYMNNISAMNNNQIVTSHRIFHKKQALYLTGDKFEGIFILRSGSAKSLITTTEGEEHITKFFYPGDLLGLDGFDNQSHAQCLYFLETSSVYYLKKSDLNELVRSNDDFRSFLLKSISHAMVCDMSMMMRLSSCSSEEKLARFILDLSEQLSQRGLSADHILLTMSRTDIANHLGMAIETVSRILAAFQQRYIIDVHRRVLTILNVEALKKCAPNGVCSPGSNIQKATSRECYRH